MEIINSLKKVLTDRINSPLAGTFILSWCVWNWKPLYVSFFVDKSKLAANKLVYVKPLFADNWNLIYSPIISTISILLLLPILSSISKLWGVYVNNNYQLRLLSLKKVTPVTKKELAVLYEELEEIEKKHIVKVERMQNKINSLNLIIDETNNPTPNGNNDALIEPDEEVESSLEMLMNVLLAIYEHSEQDVINDFWDVIMKQKLNSVFKYHKDDILDFYLDNKLLKSMNNNLYTLTPKGIKFNEQYIAFAKEQ